jgi:hypothetical protein
MSTQTKSSQSPRRTRTHRDEEVGLGRAEVERLLPDRVRAVDDAPHALLAADPHHLLPGEQRARHARDAVEHGDDLRVRVLRGRRGARERAEVRAPGGEERGARGREGEREGGEDGVRVEGVDVPERRGDGVVRRRRCARITSASA